MIGFALALQATPVAAADYFQCVRTAALSLAASKEAADVVAEGAIFSCRDGLRAVALERAAAETRKPARGVAPAPTGPRIVELEDRIVTEARGAAIFTILQDKVRRK